MKKNILYYIGGVLLVFVSSYIFIVGLSVGREGGNWRPWFAIFLVSIFLNFLYYLWLALKKHIKFALIIFYIPILIVIFIVFIFLIANRFFLVRGVYFDMGPDPFFPENRIGAYGEFTVLQKGYWSKSSREEARIKELKQMQTARQGSLIGHIGADLQGWNAEKIKTAFGEPTKIIEVDESLEKWIYHPWTNHPDWEMPVYVQNGVLLKIGD